MMSEWLVIGVFLVVLMALFLLCALGIVAALMDFGDNPHLHGLYGNGGSEHATLIY